MGGKKGKGRKEEIKEEERAHGARLFATHSFHPVNRYNPQKKKGGKGGEKETKKELLQHNISPEILLKTLFNLKKREKKKRGEKRKKKKRKE